MRILFYGVIGAVGGLVLSSLIFFIFPSPFLIHFDSIGFLAEVFVRSAAVLGLVIGAILGFKDPPDAFDERSFGSKVLFLILLFGLSPSLIPLSTYSVDWVLTPGNEQEGVDVVDESIQEDLKAMEAITKEAEAENKKLEEALEDATKLLADQKKNITECVQQSPVLSKCFNAQTKEVDLNCLDTARNSGKLAYDDFSCAVRTKVKVNAGKKMMEEGASRIDGNAKSNEEDMPPPPPPSDFDE